MAACKGEGWLYIGLFAGSVFAQLAAYTMVAWAPTYLQHTFGLSAHRAGSGFGAAHFFAAVDGTLIMPIAFRHMVATGRVAQAFIAPVWLSALGAAIIAVVPFLGSPTFFLQGHAVGGFLLIGVGNLRMLLLQPILPSQMRATLRLELHPRPWTGTFPA